MLHDDKLTDEGVIGCNAWVETCDVLHLHDGGHYC